MKFYPKHFKSPTHRRYVEMLSVLRKGISTRQTKRDMIDYLVPLIEDIKKKSDAHLPKEARIIRTLIDTEDIAHKLGSFLNFAITNSITLTRTCDLMGKAILAGKESTKINIRDRNVTRVKLGLELLDMLRKEKLITFRREAVTLVPNMLDKDVKEAKGRAPYKIKVLDEAFSLKIGIAFFYPDAERPIFTQPLLNEPSDWSHFYHDDMGEMVRNTVEGADNNFSYYKTPKVFEFMNKIKSTTFIVNTDLLEIVEENIDDPVFTYEKKIFKPIQLSSILSQQQEIMRIAGSLGNQHFYLGSFLDFRGRFYYSNTYFHPQGNKLARSLYKFYDSKRIGKKGWEALLMAAASAYGKDKLPRKKKLKYGKDKLATWLDLAANPSMYVNDTRKGETGSRKVFRKGISRAENVCGFLSLILEIKKAHDNGKYDYESNMPIFIDASNSGTQILSAMGKDLIGGALSNLIPSEEIGDVYQFIADIVWPNYKYTKAEKKIFDEISSEIISFQERMDEAHKNKKWELLKEIREEYSKFYDKNKKKIKKSAKVFWLEKDKFMRKLCKRPVMTIPYSAGPRTIARSLFDDWSSEPEMKGITGTYCFELAFDIVNAYSKALKIPTDLMKLFIDVGLRAYKKGKDLTFSSPGTGFKFVQNARKDKYERVDMDRRGIRLSLLICTGQDDKIDYDAVKSASSPNWIHALDAALMMMIVLNANYPMMIVHDSFATYPGSYEELNNDVRKVFVEMFHDNDVLAYTLAQCGSMDLYDTIDKGDLDVTGVMENDFAFDV